MAKKILYIDMDGVLVDFQSRIDQLDETKQNEYKGREDEVPGIQAEAIDVNGYYFEFQI